MVTKGENVFLAVVASLVRGFDRLHKGIYRNEKQPNCVNVMSISPHRAPSDFIRQENESSASLSVC